MKELQPFAIAGVIIALALILYAVLFVLQGVLVVLTSPIFWTVSIPLCLVAGFWLFSRR